MVSLSQPSRAILVIDDDEMMRELLAAIFAMEGYVVTTACSGAEAVLAMQQTATAFDVVLADLHMPGLAGVELAEKLNQLRVAPTALLGMSGSEPTQAERKSFDAFLVKPFDMLAFLEAVKLVQTAPTVQSRTILLQANGNPVDRPILDEAIYAKLAATLPTSQLRTLYDLALLDVEKRILAMRQARARGDVEECRREAHALKGGCAMVGAAELSALATQMETGAFEDTPPLDEFTSACSRLRRMLDARLKTPKP